MIGCICFYTSLQADIRNVGIIATELAHGALPSTSSSQSATALPSGYSKLFIDFISSCLQKEKVRMFLYPKIQLLSVLSVVQQPSVHELLQCSFVRGARESCGLESVFDLYWKSKMSKDKQLHDTLSAEWNQDQE